MDRPVYVIKDKKFDGLNLPIKDERKDIGLLIEKEQTYCQCTVIKKDNLFFLHGKALILCRPA